MTRGGVPSLKQLYVDQGYANRAQWYEIYVREAHPGERYPAPDSFETKLAHARNFKRLEEIPWPVLVDDLAGTVHRAYGGLPNAAYVIDAEGRVAFKDQWASASALRRALDALASGDGAPVEGGVERRMHLLGPMAFGWPAIQRGGDRAVREIIRTVPPLAGMLAVGHALKPVLAPLARRARPLTAGVKAASVISAVSLGLLARRRRR
jgi:hypothetical protein